MKAHPGYLILKKRKEKHLTQQELADKLYVSPTTISKWERGNNRPDLEKLKLLSSVLEIPLPQLLGIDSAETTSESDEEAITPEERTIVEKMSGKDTCVIFESETATSEMSFGKKVSKKMLHRKRNLVLAIFSMTALFLLIFTPVFFQHLQKAVPVESNNFSDLEVLRHFHGSYHDVDSCCVIVKCTEDIAKDIRYDYSENVIRKTYSPCFEKVDNIVIFYVPDYSENDNLEKTSYYITTLYPLPEFENLYSNTL